LFLLSGQADVGQHRNRSPETDNLLSDTDTASLLRSGQRRSNDTAQSHSRKKRQHFSDESVLKKTPRTNDSRMLTAAVASSTQHSEDAVTVNDAVSNWATAAVASSIQQNEDSITVNDAVSNWATAAVASSIQQNEDAITVNDAVSNCGTAAVASNIQHSEDAISVTVNDAVSNCGMADISSSTQQSQDAISVNDAVSNYGTAAVASSTQRSEDAISVTVNDAVSNRGTAAVASSIQHSEDAGTVNDTISNYVAAVDALRSTTGSTLSRVQQHIVRTVEHAAVEMHSVAGDESVVNVENNLQSSCTNSHFG